MIFVTCGTQLPFDRLLKSVDDWAVRQNVDDIVYQSARGDFVPEKGSYFEHLSPKEYDNFFSKSELIVCHAGMGTIISALEMCKKVIILPRRFDLGEHRNDHQIATCQKVSKLPNLKVVSDEADIYSEITLMLSIEEEKVGYIHSENYKNLCYFLDSFLRT